MGQACSLDAATVARQFVIPGETSEEVAPIIQVVAIIELRNLAGWPLILENVPKSQTRLPRGKGQAPEED